MYLYFFINISNDGTLAHITMKGLPSTSHRYCKYMNPNVSVLVGRK
jgi:hypothetical protein